MVDMAGDGEELSDVVRAAVQGALRETWASELSEVARAAVNHALNTGVRECLREILACQQAIQARVNELASVGPRGMACDRLKSVDSEMVPFAQSKSVGVLHGAASESFLQRAPSKERASFQQAKSVGVYHRAESNGFLHRAPSKISLPSTVARMGAANQYQFSEQGSLGSLTTPYTPPQFVRPHERIETVENLAEKQTAALLGVDPLFAVRKIPSNIPSNITPSRFRMGTKSPGPLFGPSTSQQRSADGACSPSKCGRSSVTEACSKQCSAAGPGPGAWVEVLPGLVESERLRESDVAAENASCMSPIRRESSEFSIGECQEPVQVSSTTMIADMTAVREVQEQALTSVFYKNQAECEADPPSTSFSLPVGLQVALYIYGVVPSRSRSMWACRRTCVLLTTLACGAWLSLEIYQQPDRMAHVNSQDLLCGIGAAVALFTLRWGNIRFLLSHCRSPLEAYANCRSFLQLWRMRSAWTSSVVFLLWLVEGILRLCISLYFQHDYTYLTTGISLFASSLFASLVCFHLHICEALTIMVDDYCTQFFAFPDFPRGIREWNTLQAVLRQAGKSIDSCSLVLTTFALTAAVLDGASMFFQSSQEGLADRLMLQIGPSVLKVSLALFVLHKAAAVSEKCTQAPALINSVTVEGSDTQPECNLDLERQYLVQYMEASAAGFYIKGVRINSFMVMKVSYVLASALLLLAMKTNHG